MQLPISHQRALHQWFTPIWAAEALIERHFPDLSADDFVLEPSCGLGHFLQALTAVAPVTPRIGIELDPELATLARERAGCPVMTGDFRALSIPVTPTHIIGNPPFDTETIDGFLSRSYQLLPEGGQVGFIVPCYLFQTASRTTRYASLWSLFQELIPRNLFPNLSLPLVFAIFTKEHYRKLVGFGLYHETMAIQSLPGSTKATLTSCITSGSVWRQAVSEALQELGGEASLQMLYGRLETRRPTTTLWWRQKIRQTLQRYFVRTGPGRYALAA